MHTLSLPEFMFSVATMFHVFTRYVWPLTTTLPDQKAQALAYGIASYWPPDDGAKNAVARR